MFYWYSHPAGTWDQKLVNIHHDQWCPNCYFGYKVRHDNPIKAMKALKNLVDRDTIKV